MLCRHGFLAAPLRSLSHSRAANLLRSRASMSGLAVAPPTAAPPPPLPTLPAPTPAVPLPYEQMIHQMQFLVAELARKDLAASAEREAMRAEAVAASAERERKDLAASAERERKDLAASAEREAMRAVAQAASAKAAEEKEAAWEAKTMVLQHKLDLSEGAVRARSLYNACLRDIAKRVVDKSKLQQVRSASSVEAMLMNGASCPALRTYLGAVAIANKYDPAEVQQQGRGMYGMLSDPLHSEQSMHQGLPAALFERDKGQEALIAFAAVVRFSGRNPALYCQGGQSVVLVLPTPPHSCSEEVAGTGAAAAAAGASAATGAAVARSRAPEKVRVSVRIMDEGRVLAGEEEWDE